MQEDSFIIKISAYARENIFPLILALFGLVLIIYGLISLSSINKQDEDIVFKSEEQAQKENPVKIFIDIEGAVVKPGVYELEEGSRVKDVLIMASGLAENADRNWVSRNLNLASKLIDGSKIYIPQESEGFGGLTTGINQSANQQIELISINYSNVSELDKLPGVGPVTAEKIISNRPYQNIEELLTKKVVGQKVFEQIKDKISLY